MSFNSNQTKISLPSFTEFNVPATGLADLLNDLASVGVTGVVVTSVLTSPAGDSAQSHYFTVSITAEQLGLLINQHATALLVGKYTH
jgi:hypothetical protein